mgnify:CR=1 FL=1
MKIAVVGAGIFGITTAVRLSRNHSVDIFERYDDIMKGASGINQFRMHKGYHYPRSYDTALDCMKAQKSFRREYGDAMMDDFENYYCLAKEGSLTTKDQYLKFCDKLNLDYSQGNLDLVNKEKIDLCLKVKESLIDPFRIKEICSRRIKERGINLLLNKKASMEMLEGYDYIIISTYSNMNSLLGSYPASQKDYQFELCEKLVLELPEVFNNKSIVIIDGPLFCVDPYGRSGKFLMGNVVHAIHEANIGKFPKIDDRYSKMLDSGIIKKPQVTKFREFIESAAEFMPEIKKAKHVGSMFTIRTVLPYIEKTDARPTIVEKIDNRIITVFSGKIPTCVDAAESIEKMIDN